MPVEGSWSHDELIILFSRCGAAAQCFRKHTRSAVRHHQQCSRVPVYLFRHFACVGRLGNDASVLKSDLLAARCSLLRQNMHPDRIYEARWDGILGHTPSSRFHAPGQLRISPSRHSTSRRTPRFVHNAELWSPQSSVGGPLVSTAGSTRFAATAAGQCVAVVCNLGGLIVLTVEDHPLVLTRGFNSNSPILENVLGL